MLEHNNSGLSSSKNSSLNDTFRDLCEAQDNIKNEYMQHSSWWWCNLFSEMENEGIIKPNEAVITHFL